MAESTASHAPTLSPEQLEAFGRELDAIRDRVLADLGERDATYIRKMVKTQRRLEVGGRGLLFRSFFPPAWLGAGSSAHLTLPPLSLA